MKNHPRQREGAHKRFFWLAKKRLGPRWWDMPEREVARLLRRWSHRRVF